MRSRTWLVLWVLLLPLWSWAQTMHPQVGHSSKVVDAIFSPDGAHIVSISADNTARLWGVSSGKELRTFLLPETPRSLAIDPAGKLLAVGGRSGSLTLWKLSTGEGLRSWKAHSSWIASLAFSPDGKLLASGAGDGVASLWEVDSGGERVSFPGTSSWPIDTLAFSPGGKWLAAGGFEP